MHRRIMDHAKKYLSASSLMRILATAALLVAAYRDNSYQYYMFLRIGVTFVAAYMFYVGLVTKRYPWVVVFAFIAVIFNPIVPLKEATRDTWIIIDTLAAIICCFSILFVGENLTADEEHPLAILKNRTVRIAIAVVLIIGGISSGVYYYEVVLPKQAYEEQLEANRRAAASNAMSAAANAALAAANAAKKAADEAANSVAIQKNTPEVPSLSDVYPNDIANNLQLPCYGQVSNYYGDVVMRSSPGVKENNLITSLSDGDSIRITGLSSNKRWVRILTDSQQSGWVSVRFVKCE